MLSPAGGSCLGRRRPSSRGCGGGRRTHRLSTAAPKHARMNEYLYIYPHESKIMRIHQHINRTHAATTRARGAASPWPAAALARRGRSRDH